MTIKQISVTAGRTFNHPHESYSNLRPSVTMVADLAETDDPKEATKALQREAEGLVEDHKQSLLKSLEELFELSVAQQQARGLLAQLQSCQQQLDQIRANHPDLKLTNGQEEPPPTKPDYVPHAFVASDTSFICGICAEPPSHHNHT